MADVQETTEKLFDVDANSSFKIENVNGEVNIETWSQSSIQVTAVASGDSQEDLDNVSIDMELNDNNLVVETKYKKKGWGRRKGNKGGSRYDHCVFFREHHSLSYRRKRGKKKGKKRREEI